MKIPSSNFSHHSKKNYAKDCFDHIPIWTDFKCYFVSLRMPSHEELEKRYENTVSTSASEVIEQVVEYSPGNSGESGNMIFPPNNRRRVKILKKVPRMKNRFTSKHGWIHKGIPYF